MPTYHTDLILFLATALLLAGCSSPAITPPQTAKISTIAETTGEKTGLIQKVPSSVSQPSMTVYLDPNTGEILSNRIKGQESLEISPKMQNAMSTSDTGLFEKRSTVPGGGFIVDLQGRFQSPMVHIQHSNGDVQTKHLDEIIKPAAK